MKSDSAANHRFFLCLALVLAGLSIGARAQATFNDLHSGTLLLDFAGDVDTRWVAPGLETDVELLVSGPVVRATVTQTFANPGDQWANATYVFPLPETAAVDHMTLVVGERIIEGQIQPREKARAMFDEARRAGKKASLVSQQRPNLFTTGVANIPPGEEIRVSIQYQQPVDRDGDLYSLRFPMTITPRYIPGRPLAVDDSEAATPGDGWSPDTDAVPDASAITPPWGPGGTDNHPTRVRVSLQPGFALASVDSLYHQVQREDHSADGVTLTLSPQAHRANRDFVLQWQPAASAEPQVAAFSERRGGELYSLLMFTPPAPALAAPPPPREVVFVIDTSGSMGGEPIRQARRALRWALDRLRPEDRFNIIEFNSGHWPLFGTARQATTGNLKRATAFVDRLEARGGTEMLGAMDEALCPGCGQSEILRQVIFLTDGAIGNEDQLFQLIQQRLGANRLFTVGIGGAPNSYFMRKAAETGRGTYTYVASLDGAGEAMARLFATLEAPMLTDLALEVGGELEITPNPLPDLYAGQPLVVLARGEIATPVTLSGRLGSRPWRQVVNPESVVERPGIAALWGRSRIDDLGDRRRYSRNEKSRQQLEREITDLALEHHLVSAFTSLVAVDVSPGRPADADARDHHVANNSPAGTGFGLAATATPAALKLMLGTIFALLALTLVGWQRHLDRRRAAEQDATILALRATL